MWRALNIYVRSGCGKQCPYCHEHSLSDRTRPLAFFESILLQSLAIPEWNFSFGLVSAQAMSDLLALIHIPWRTEHPYALETNYENLQRLPLDIFRKSKQVVLRMDEIKVPESETMLFFRTLNWAKKEGVPLSVRVTLTETMIRRLGDSLLLERLLNACRKIYFDVPKSEHLSFLSRDQFGDFLDYICQKMTRLEVLKKVEIDPCLLPVLTPWKMTVNPECALARTLSLMPDGTVRLCPHSRAYAHIPEPDSWSVILGQPPGLEETMEKLRYCQWREAWKCQEDHPLYGAQIWEPFPGGSDLRL